MYEKMLNNTNYYLGQCLFSSFGKKKRKNFGATK